MQTTEQLIQSAIDDLLDSSVNLTNVLLKLKVIAFKLKNEELKKWVNSELNGYKTEPPEYRKKKTALFAVLSSPKGLVKDFMLPLELLPKTKKHDFLREKLSTLIFWQGVPELTAIANGDEQIKTKRIPSKIYELFSHLTIEHGEATHVYQKVDKSAFEGVLNRIKSHLLDFLMQLSEELETNVNIPLNQKSENINDIFKNTIGEMNKDNSNIHVYFNSGDNSSQVINTGTQRDMNVVSGENATQNISSKKEAREVLKEFIEQVKSNLSDFEDEDREDIENQLVILESQSKREILNSTIINPSLNVVYNILAGVTANAWFPVVMEQLTVLKNYFT